MMKRICTILVSLLLLCSCAKADSPLLSSASERLIFSAIQSALKSGEIDYGMDEEYMCCYFSMDLNNNNILGYADVALYAFSDGVSVCSSFYEPVPAAYTDEVIRLCNLFNSGVYTGKFYLDTYENYLCYETFRPLSALSIRSADKEAIMDDAYLCLSVLDYYGEYFGEVIHHGEKAENAFAMYLADEE